MTRIAIAVDTDGRVARFGHGNDVLIINPDGSRTQRTASDGGCCGTLAERIADCDALIASGIGHGAQRHVLAHGVELYHASAGSDPQAGVEQVLADRGGIMVATGCDHDHHQHASGTCGCGHHDATGHGAQHRHRHGHGHG